MFNNQYQDNTIPGMYVYNILCSLYHLSSLSLLHLDLSLYNLHVHVSEGTFGMHNIDRSSIFFFFF